MHSAASSAIESEQSQSSNGNGTGVLATLGKSSWLLGMLLTVTTAGVGGYFAVKQDMTVGLATLQLQLRDNESDIKEIKIELKQMVPAEVHDARREMQAEVDKWHDAYLNERLNRIEEELREMRSKK